MTLDIDRDLSIADGSETVTVNIKRADGETELSVSGALRRALGRPHEIFSGVVLQGDELVWNVPHSELGAAELQRGDTIADVSGAVWTILAAARLTFGTRWRCVCRKEQ